MKNPDIQICGLIESKINEIILEINQTYSILEANKMHSELRILDWIFFKFLLTIIIRFSKSNDDLLDALRFSIGYNIK